MKFDESTLTVFMLKRAIKDILNAVDGGPVTSVIDHMEEGTDYC